MDKINWVTSECFNAIAQLARFHEGAASQPDMVHARMRSFLDGLTRRAQEAGYSEQEQKLILYAIAALADEVVMAAGGPIRERWTAQPLQLLYFRDNLAGERFFQHLEQARRAPPQIDVLRTYYLCLLLGFRGRYGVRGAEVLLDDLMESVRVQLTRALPVPELLAPHGARPEEGLLAKARAAPLLALAGGLVTLATILYLGLAVTLREQFEQFVTQLQRAAGG